MRRVDRYGSAAVLQVRRQSRDRRQRRAGTNWAQSHHRSRRIGAGPACHPLDSACPRVRNRSATSHKPDSGPSAAGHSAGTPATESRLPPIRLNQNPPQPPMPHCGRPQLPAGDGLQTGKSRAADVCAAGTLSSFSSFGLSHSGQCGVSFPRTSNSNSAEH
jgi:hypothetical protein